MKVFGMITEDTCIALADKMPEGLHGFSRGAFNYFSKKTAAGEAFTDKYYKKYNMYPGGRSLAE